MTYEETLKCIEGSLMLCEGANVFSGSADFWETAKKAVEKQIPKKPKIDRITFTNGSGYFDELCCPTCNNYLIQRDDCGKYFAGSQNNYCEECGQKIDWRDEK